MAPSWLILDPSRGKLLLIAWMGGMETHPFALNPFKINIKIIAQRKLSP